MNTRRQGKALAATALVGCLTLGACGPQRATSEGAVDDGPAVAEADQGYQAEQVGELRLRYPTAGDEVPPADLLRESAPAPGVDAPRTRPTTLHRHVE